MMNSPTEPKCNARSDDSFCKCHGNVVHSLNSFGWPCLSVPALTRDACLPNKASCLQTHRIVACVHGWCHYVRQE